MDEKVVVSMKEKEKIFSRSTVICNSSRICSSSHNTRDFTPRGENSYEQGLTCVSRNGLCKRTTRECVYRLTSHRTNKIKDYGIVYETQEPRDNLEFLTEVQNTKPQDA